MEPDFALWLATDPGTMLLDAKLAVELAERGVKLEHENWSYWQSHGSYQSQLPGVEVGESLAALEKFLPTGEIKKWPEERLAMAVVVHGPPAGRKQGGSPFVVRQGRVIRSGLPKRICLVHFDYPGLFCCTHTRR